MTQNVGYFLIRFFVIKNSGIQKRRQLNEVFPFFREARPVGNCFTSCWWPDFFLLFLSRSQLPSLTLHAHISSPNHFVRAQAFCLYESTRYGLEDLSCVAMPPPSKRLYEIESWSFTWQSASLKDPDEDNKRYPWRMPTPVESEPVATPSPVGPIALWRAAMITKYDLMMIEFDRHGKRWTISQRSKHYSVTRMILCDRPQSVKFMPIVTEPPNVSTREVTALS